MGKDLTFECCTCNGTAVEDCPAACVEWDPDPWSSSYNSDCEICDDIGCIECRTCKGTGKITEADTDRGKLLKATIEALRNKANAIEKELEYADYIVESPEGVDFVDGACCAQSNAKVLAKRYSENQDEETSWGIYVKIESYRSSQ